jgi:hypothetical protein
MPPQFNPKHALQKNQSKMRRSLDPSIICGRSNDRVKQNSNRVGVTDVHREREMVSGKAFLESCHWETLPQVEKGRSHFIPSQNATSRQGAENFHMWSHAILPHMMNQAIVTHNQQSTSLLLFFLVFMASLMSRREC